MKILHVHMYKYVCVSECVYANELWMLSRDHSYKWLLFCINFNEQYFVGICMLHV